MDCMDCSPPGSSVHGIVQATILEWVAISFSRGSSWIRDGTQVSCTEPQGKPERVVGRVKSRDSGVGSGALSVLRAI